MRDIKVGDVLVVVIPSGRREIEPSFGEVTVTRVGRDYFYTGKGWNERKFHRSNGRENTDYLPMRCYRSREEYERDVERKRAVDGILTRSRNIRRDNLEALSDDKLNEVFALFAELAL